MRVHFNTNNTLPVPAITRATHGNNCGNFHYYASELSYTQDFTTRKRVYFVPFNAKRNLASILD